MSLTLIFSVILLALVFAYINGFHDTANSIATVVSTRVLSPRQAIALAALANLLGALWGTAVARTIASGLVDVKVVTSQVLVCALLGAIIWNLVTWWYGMPSSSSHALIGGLCGGCLAAAHNDWSVIIWSQPSAEHWRLNDGVLWKVIVPMAASPLLGFLVGLVVMGVLYLGLRRAAHSWIDAFFSRLQIASAAGMGLMHGANDAQKTMGIIALALVAGTSAGAFAGAPGWLGFLKTDGPAAGASLEIATWIEVVCALTMAAGTAAGGWRITKTLGQKMVKLQPVHGFAAEASSATVIWLATTLGIPISTTHNISAAIMGAGAAKRLNAVKWTVVEQMAWAWVLTLPVTAGLAYLLVRLMQVLGWIR